MKFKQRMSAPPGGIGICFIFKLCPDLWELDDGNFVAIGKDVTSEVEANLPDDVHLSPGERVVMLPRAVVTSAKPNLPEA